MANADHLKILREGVDAWNAWREASSIIPDLRGANLSGADLHEVDLFGAYVSEADLCGADLSRAGLGEAKLDGANLNGANLNGANLRGTNLGLAYLIETNLSGAVLVGADLSEADLSRADLSRADLSGADLGLAHLNGANLNGADLRGTNLNGAVLVGADLTGADLTKANLMGASLLEADITNADHTGCRIYGVSAWGLKLSDETSQRNLIITWEDDPEITVDNIEVAQFIYLLLHNQKIREVIDTITSKVVLILGRFTDERKAVLDALRDELRKREYLPILFDFNKPASRTTDETIALLARMARFVIADLSDAKSVLQELRGIVPALPSVLYSLSSSHHRTSRGCSTSTDLTTGSCRCTATRRQRNCSPNSAIG
jgi:uncharacterized protein YjbI with pentapeptide repeats